MDSQELTGGQTLPTPQASEGRTVVRRRRRVSRSVESSPKSTLAQVTVQVPRDVLAAFDDYGATAGVNRQHLIREALMAYAAMLDGGCRVYQVPGVGRGQERAA